MATTYPVESVVRPSSLACARNGDLEANQLSVVGWGQVLETTAARSWAALWTAAQKAGWDLTFTYGGCYRSYAMQRRLFLARWSPQHIAGRPTVWWAGGQWWLLPGVARSAVPGTSTHGWGLAVDVALGNDPATAEPITPALSWLLDVADLFGWSWESQSEPWHINYVRGDKIPDAVLQTEAWLSSQQ